ncbi:MAG: ABC transporter ATP-binding protein [Thermoplasmata archaeon]
MTETPIRLESLGKTFGHVAALEDLSMEIPTGSTYFLLGPNGSGKTTMVHLLTGVLRPTAGTLRVFDLDPYRQPHKTARRLSVAYENHHLPSWASARIFLRFVSRIRKLEEEEVERSAQAFGLVDYWERPMGTYSAGMRKRVMLAQAWMGDPELLLLDEPFSNLDPEGRRLLAGLLEDRLSSDLTTVVSTHLAETLAPPSHLAFLLDGHLEADGPIGHLADQFEARSAVLVLARPAEAVQILLDQGQGDVTASQDRVVVKGTSETILAAQDILEEAGLAPDATKEEYDIWAIYRALLAGRPARSKRDGSET